MPTPPTPSPKMSSKQRPRQLAPAPAQPPLINGIPAPFVNATMKLLMAMPSARTVTLRPNRNFLDVKSRAINAEAWLGTQVGTLATRQCTHCAKGSGPFTSCIFIEGHFKESCTNCHYGGVGSRCSFRLVFGGEDYINAVAQALANDVPSPEIPGMAPANNFGGTIGTRGGFGEAFGNAISTGIIDTIAGVGVNGAALPLSGSIIANTKVPHGGRGQKRIAPATVNVAVGTARGFTPLLNYGSTFESAVAYARTLTYQGRRNEKVRLQKELAAIAQVEEELEGSEAEEGEDEDMDDVPVGSIK